MNPERDHQIRRLTGHYGIMLRVILALRFFAGNAKALDNWLIRHAKSFQVIPHALGNHSLYQLTRAAARELGFSDARAQSYGSRAIAQRLAVLLFCESYLGIRRRLMEPAQVERLTGHKLKGTHVLEETFLQPGKSDRKIGRLYLVLTPDPKAKFTHTLKTIRETLDEISTLTERRAAPFAPAEWLAARRYGIAVLTDQEDKNRRMREALREADLFSITHFAVETLPRLEDVAHLLKEVPDEQNEPAEPTA
jgi:hypothetical protein